MEYFIIINLIILLILKYHNYTILFFRVVTVIESCMNHKNDFNFFLILIVSVRYLRYYNWSVILASIWKTKTHMHICDT